jgi:hypothetical protein
LFLHSNAICQGHLALCEVSAQWADLKKLLILTQTDLRDDSRRRRRVFGAKDQLIQLSQGPPEV